MRYRISHDTIHTKGREKKNWWIIDIHLSSKRDDLRSQCSEYQSGHVLVAILFLNRQ
jgi:hypothetical protein